MTMATINQLHRETLSPGTLYAVRATSDGRPSLTVNRMIAGLALPTIPRGVRMPPPGRGWRWSCIRMADLADLADAADAFGFARKVEFRALPYRLSPALSYSDAEELGAHLGERLAALYGDGAGPAELAARFIEDVREMHAVERGDMAVKR